LLLLGASAFAAALVEAGLRLAMDPQLGIHPLDPPPHSLWASDPELGWDNPRARRTSYGNGLFRAEVGFDDDAIRLNHRGGTTRPGWPNWLFIGDSTTVSLEVDDDATVPALLERALRSKGREINVLNLGVRGYGTDQAVDKAIRIARRRGAEEAIYLFVPNDAYETNVAKTWGHPHSKPLDLYDLERGTFEHRPPRALGLREGQLVVLDEACRPYLHEGATEVLPPREEDSPLSVFYLYRAWFRFYAQPRREVAAGRRDPHHRVQEGESWSHGFVPAYLDGGVLRNRCPDYFLRQMRFHLERLRAETGIRTLHVVHFPHERAIRMRREGGSENVRMFDTLLEAGVIDSYLDLNAEIEESGVLIQRLRCPGDPHLCSEGNAWIAERILAARALWESGQAATGSWLRHSVQR